MAAGLADHVWTLTEWLDVPSFATRIGHQAFFSG